MPSRLEPSPRKTFRRRHRLSGSDAFSYVFKSGIRKASGPFMLIAVPNTTPEHRLGLSIGKRVGGAVRRVAVKRRLREAFRLSRAELPSAPGSIGYDWIVAARPHPPMTTAQYQEVLLTLAARVSREWHKRASRGS